MRIKLTLPIISALIRNANGPKKDFIVIGYQKERVINYRLTNNFARFMPESKERNGIKYTFRVTEDLINELKKLTLYIEQ
jgi:hypothetical protein